MEVEQENELAVTDNVGQEAPAETVQTETPAEGAEQVEQTPEQEAEALGRAEAEAAESEETADEEAETEGEEEEHKPNVKFKAGVFNKENKQLEQKEFEIDPKFHGLMKDPEGEKLVRELHEKAYGLQSVKERFELVRQENQQIATENMSIKGSIDGMRKTYQSAVQSGNFHKLDGFFAKLDIPQDVILKYALAKVQLNEASPEQQQAVMAQIKAESDAEVLAQQREQFQSQNFEQQIQMKEMMLDHTLARAEIASLANEYDTRVGKPEAFKQLVRREGQLAWHTENVDLSPEQAIKRVIENFGLKNGSHGLPAAQQQTATQTTSPGSTAKPPPVVKRTAKTIPNVQGRSTSPLQGKTRTMEQLLKYRKEQHGI